MLAVGFNSDFGAASCPAALNFRLVAYLDLGRLKRDDWERSTLQRKLHLVELEMERAWHKAIGALPRFAGPRSYRWDEALRLSVQDRSAQTYLY
jgi:hypothetical protein